MPLCNLKRPLPPTCPQDGAPELRDGTIIVYILANQFNSPAERQNYTATLILLFSNIIAFPRKHYTTIIDLKTAYLKKGDAYLRKWSKNWAKYSMGFY